MKTYKIKLSGGPLDGHEQDVPADSRWDEVKKAGVANSQGKIFATYRWQATGIREVDATTAITEDVLFRHEPDLMLEPGETARVLRMHLG